MWPLTNAICLKPQATAGGTATARSHWRASATRHLRAAE
eukprot:CAMPEP_0181172292 /NCGR_PEP_ID=MMETSP1096-20121128/2372_1 /TAXON_ID=156174 ORGANISM="Chrysochromulina ericina, Strain CCMP281" /NCGR_SAMPLE_ID=MMETSP1096 /ASSEMBLY_ACC=CAM_ASM_000453 /LENGTH=38 /DNA_ID= /DNA_START= /DNA_END= /DNA_ORIENTATION=